MGGGQSAGYSDPSGACNRGGRYVIEDNGDSAIEIKQC